MLKRTKTRRPSTVTESASSTRFRHGSARRTDSLLIPSGIGGATLLVAWVVVAVGGSEQLVFKVGLGFIVMMLVCVVQLILLLLLPCSAKWTACLTLLSFTTLSGVIGIPLWAAALQTACNGRPECPLG